MSRSRPRNRLDATPLLELKAVTAPAMPEHALGSRIRGLLGHSLPGTQVRNGVDDASLRLLKGDAVAIVGEGGCGKSTLGRIAAGMQVPATGERLWNGGVFDADDRLSRQWGGSDAGAALKPRKRVFDIIAAEPLANRLIQPREAVEYVGLWLNRVGIDPTTMRRYPREFSHGQRTRIALAQAFAVKPELLVCDEVTT